MFSAVQKMVRSANTIEGGLIKAIDIAQRKPKLFPPKAYWKKAKIHLPHFPVNKIRKWAKEGLQALDEREGWELVLLDLGDCPETFILYSPGGQHLLDEKKVRRWLVRAPVLACGDLERFFAHQVEDKFRELFGHGRKVWTDHNVIELDDPVLTWNRSGSVDFHGNSGYLLWLVFGSLAFLDPLRDARYCRRILKGRERLHLLSGFEEIFLYLATVTPAGLVFEKR